MAPSDLSRCGSDPHREWQEDTHTWSELDCQCYVGPTDAAGFSGHEFNPFSPDGDFFRRPCGRPGVWRGLWQCGDCPDTHVALVCHECRAHHDADAAFEGGATLVWARAQW